MKIDPPNELMELKDWWNKHGTAVSTAVLVVVAVILGVRFWQNRKEKTAEQASYAAANARSIPELEKVAADYPSSGEAPAALLKSAAMYCQSGEFATAQEKYQAILDRYPKHSLASLARLGLGYTLEAQGKYAEAADHYRGHLADHGVPDILSGGADGSARDSLGDGDYLNPVAMLGLARCKVLEGDKSSAHTILDQISAGYPNTLWGEQARTVSENLDRIRVTSPLDLLGTIQDAAADDDIPATSSASDTATDAAGTPAADATGTPASGTAPADAPSDAPADSNAAAE